MTPLKNYRARPNAKTSPIEKIQQVLSAHQIQSMSFTYMSDGKVKDIIFTMVIKNKTFGFKLPARVENVARIMYDTEYKYLDGKKQTQAYTTAWANIRDWIDAQMALIDTEQVKLEEVFLPYAMDKTGKTFFEHMQETNYQLPSGT